MTQPELCIRCKRRERYARLLVCAECSNRLVAPKAQEPIPFRAPWRDRLTARDETWRRAA